MHNTCYIVYAYRDPFQLPLAFLDTFSELCDYINASRRQVFRLLAGDVEHIDGYSVDVVTL